VEQVTAGLDTHILCAVAQAVYLSTAESSMIKEEITLRIQSLQSGSSFACCHALLDRVLTATWCEVPFSYHGEFGFPRRCPTTWN